jgi:phospholipid/cholesterol/gamma-HCH transport system ATP-binding protein
VQTLQHTLGVTIMMATHDLDSLKTVCDRIAALVDGKIVAEGSLETMLASTHPWVEAYFKGKRAADELGRAAAEARVQ